MADNAQDRPNSKGWFASGESKSLLAVTREEFGRQWGTTPGDAVKNGIGATVLGGLFGGLIGLIPAFGAGLYTDAAVTTADQAMAYGLTQENGYRVIDLNGRDLAIFHENGEYQVYNFTGEEDKDSGNSLLRYIAGMPDALEALDNTVALIDDIQAKMAAGQSLAGLDLPGVQSLKGASIAYDRGGDNIVRFFRSAVTDPRVNNDYAALLSDVRAELVQARAGVLDGGYGADGLRRNGVEPKTGGGRVFAKILLSMALLGMVAGLNMPNLDAVKSTRARVRKNKGLDKKNG